MGGIVTFKKQKHKRSHVREGHVNRVWTPSMWPLKTKHKNIQIEFGCVHGFINSMCLFLGCTIHVTLTDMWAFVFLFFEGHNSTH
jgi:hypothetical protein